MSACRCRPRSEAELPLEPPQAESARTSATSAPRSRASALSLSSFRPVPGQPQVTMFTCRSRSVYESTMTRARTSPTVPPGGRGGASTPVRSGAALAVAAHLVRKRAHVDRLLEVAGETRRRQPVAAPRVGARRSARRPGSAPFARPPRSSRATSVPSMSGSRRSSRMTSGRRSAASAIASSPVGRPRASGARRREARPGRASGSSRCRRR